MKWGMVICEECGQPYSARIRDDGSFVLPTDRNDCSECGSTQFSQTDEEAVGDD